jgi:SNF2 family DNA or RNA helicase
MALAYLDGDKIRLRSEWRERDLCKAAACRWDPDTKTWWTNLSWATCVMLRGVFADNLEISQELSDWAGREINSRIEPCLRLRQSTEPREVYCAPGMELEVLQTVGVDFLATAGRALCGDGMGSGKTVEAICAVEELALRSHEDNGRHVFPVLVICTNTMVRKWAEEIHTWAPHASVGILKGGAATRRKTMEAGHDYYVINWELLKAHSRVAGYGSIALNEDDKLEKELNALDIGTVIADEAHRGKNPKAKQTRAWWYLSWKARYSLAFTGTPVTRSPEDLWSIMHGIEPTEWPSKTAWIDRYGLKAWSPFGGMNVTGLRGDTQDELFKFLDPRFIRRPTNVIIPDLEKKRDPDIRRIDMAPKQAKAYKQMKKEMIAILDDGDYTMATDTLSQMTRLLQLSSSYIEIDEEGKVTMTDPSCKVDALMDIVEELDDDPIVVFAMHKQLIDLAAARLTKSSIPYGLITSDVPELERSQYVQQFQQGQLPVFLATLGAGGEGITLTKAKHVLFMQRSFSRTQNEQATDRVWRRGQDRPVQPIWLLSEGTLEERVIQAGEERDATFEEIVRDEATIRRMLEV